ncbi:agamous-like MADS-box protein AGL8 homolog [Jatropha curcas]|uniref:agamous-like MADS-box protein AGL8 homolog n=1 Tax=Jatropha curcas TaxID=180498 RepID=UPI0018934EF3|nr:agamous-like MADS-box protein AGL8 homolog [Jatropha curcas]
MGRSKIILKKIENPTYRHITFAKRKSGIIKKAYELSTLCDIEIALIVFSPAGKLFLYEGKKRLEEIIDHYFDLPDNQRQRLHNEELIKRIAHQLGLETNIYHHLVMAGRCHVRSGSQMQVIQNEIQIFSSEVEDVEKQISQFLKSPSSIETVTEAEHQENTFIETLKHVQIRKQLLEEIESFQSVPEQPFYPMNINSDGFMMGSSSYNPVDRPLQFDFDVPGFSEFPLFSNQEQNFPELQPPLAFLDGYGFPLNYVQNNDNNFNACVPYSHQMGQFPNMNLPSTSTSTSTINTNEQGSASNAPVQGQEGDPATGFYNPGYGNYPFRF